MAESPEAASVSTDIRGPVATGVLVGLVVLVLGFGAGLGAVWERVPGSSGGARQGNDLGGAVQASPPAGDVTATVETMVETAAPASSTPTMAPEASTTEGLTSTATPRRSPVPSTPSTPTSRPPTSTSLPPAVEPAGPQPACDAGVVSASVEPFVEHLEAAHLETSPGQQVADALSVDSYALTHTVLVARMLAPLMAVADVAPAALDPFLAHLRAAHLETSPGQQVADALSVDSYALAHTILVGQMADPVVTAVAGEGC